MKTGGQEGTRSTTARRWGLTRKAWGMQVFWAQRVYGWLLQQYTINYTDAVSAGLTPGGQEAAGETDLLFCHCWSRPVFPSCSNRFARPLCCRVTESFRDLCWTLTAFPATRAFSSALLIGQCHHLFVVCEGVFVLADFCSCLYNNPIIVMPSSTWGQFYHILYYM